MADNSAGKYPHSSCREVIALYFHLLPVIGILANYILYGVLHIPFHEVC